MSLKVLICRMIDGEIRDYIEHYYNTWNDAEYIWTDGNYECDCNRSLFFKEDVYDVSCGSNMYTICVIENGIEVYKDEGFPEDPECPASKPTKPIVP